MHIDRGVDSWDGIEKRQHASVSEQLSGLRHDVNELKTVMSDVAAALRQLAVLEEQYAESRSVMDELRADTKNYVSLNTEQHTDIQKTIAYYKGALAVMSSILVIGFGSISAVASYIWHRLDESTFHAKSDEVTSRGDVEAIFKRMIKEPRDQ